MRKEIEARITGKVQMVMFRDFVKRKADALYLKGTVENLDDGSVRVIAQGEENDLYALIAHLHKGPFLARVARVSILWRDSKKEYSQFTIIY
jgi:acylphosphatase